MLYPVVANRMASFHNVISKNIDSSSFYAQEALRTAPKFKLYEEEATANMLLFYSFKGRKAYEQALKHAFAALRIFQKIEDATSINYMNMNICSLYYANNEMQLAFLLRQLKHLTGLSPIQYLLEIRLDKARTYLENRDYKTVAQVAAHVGRSF